MKQDIVKRLRASMGIPGQRLTFEAADEIERLRLEMGKLSWELAARDGALMNVVSFLDRQMRAKRRERKPLASKRKSP